MTSDPGSRTVRYTVKMQCERVEAMFIGVWKGGGRGRGWGGETRSKLKSY